jgi:hypothetical protein
MKNYATHLLIVALLIFFFLPLKARCQKSMYLITLSEHVFVDKGSEITRYSSMDIMDGKALDLINTMQRTGQSELFFERVVPQAIPGDTIRYGRRTGWTPSNCSRYVLALLCRNAG